MKKIWIITLLLAIFGASTTATAGHIKTTNTYQVENGVKVYRHGPTQAQKAANQRNLAIEIATQRQRAHHQAQQARMQQSSYENGFAQGFKNGVQATQNLQRNAYPKRRRYGRRYSTGFYGTQFGFHGRPVNLGPSRRFPRR